jgi:hypothetical protein
VWLPRDLVAGFVLSALLVPQGMAYAELVGLPAITGPSTIRPTLSANQASLVIEESSSGLKGAYNAISNSENH